MDCRAVVDWEAHRAGDVPAEAGATAAGGREGREGRVAQRVAKMAAWAEAHREMVEATDTADTRVVVGREGLRAEHLD